ncbi:Atxe2 family lasso peptide isopeptidase [Sphingomonas sp. BIUV-7]|uniref:Atxe2 family lasso peptide isopeptidase n=1 Tax=Sphingomonas natans TaxID=3063330 RepID=A0ABT8YAR3_9SPHN|nr:Atxe2 family lasso peptide isopeptidase [Sphingomonas sp. BIUV-7]MDO6415426.1 Atxe2 family lasso peptide isopeptidase [Sphingomonas sp. BIUV-7]
MVRLIKALILMAALACAAAYAPTAWSLPPVALAGDSACADLLPGPGAAVRRASMIDDLLGLRDMGFSHLADLDRVMSISPDGREAAFVLSRADPKTNAYCQVVMVVSTDGSGRRRVLDIVGQPDLSRTTIRGLSNPSGLPAQNVPRWSADGSSLAYLKRVGAISEAWRVNVQSGKRDRISAPGVDVERLAWLAKGKALAVGYRDGRAAASSELEREGRSGYLFDERFATYTGNKPLQRANLPLAFQAVDPDTGRAQALTEDERASIGGPRILDSAARALLAAEAAGRKAWTAQEDGNDFMSPVRIWSQGKDGKSVRCEDDACIGMTLRHFITALWLSPDGGAVYWMRRTGWADGDIALYRWRPGEKIRKILQTSDLLIDCQPAATGIYCLHEASQRPRTLVRIDEQTGRWRTVWDPNPQWQDLDLGSVQRLHWRNDLGFEIYGDLVLPPGYRTGTKLPLIIVQYTSRGLLRGGTGDEYPIFSFAARGYAVLSFNMPQLYYSYIPGGHWSTPAAAERESTKGWRQRWSVLSALENGIQLVIDRGVGDPNALGISGLSDGSTTAQMALVQKPDQFKAASLSACCLEPEVMMIFGGTALSDERRAWDFPLANDAERARWAPLSISLHPEAVKTPVLLSNGDNEILVGVETYMALRQAGKPVEMYIYPDEYHLKTQPAHRQAIYRRNLAWFDFWIRRREDHCLASDAEFGRWRKMPGAPPADRLEQVGVSCAP